MLMREMYYPNVTLSVENGEFTIATGSERKKILAISIAAALRDQHAVRAQIAGAKALGVTLSSKYYRPAGQRNATYYPNIVLP
jgi:hypothetical protein